MAKTQLQPYDLLGAVAPALRRSIGFDRWINDLERLASVDDGHYPPYNIIKHSDTEYAIQVAIAGLSIDDVNVSVYDNTLQISAASKEKETGAEYVWKGISTKSFRRTFTLAEHVEVTSAEAKDGILTVGLVRVVPESKQTRKIDITVK